MTAHTTSFIVNGSDYFVANLDNGGVRVGMVNGPHFFNFGENHNFCAIARELETEAQAEDMFDFLIDLYA